MDVYEALEQHVGYSGRMLSGSKSAYHDAHPDHTVFFNACVFNGKFTQVWHGDVDVTAESDKMQAAADASGQTLYLTREHRYRWDGLDKKSLKAGLKDETVYAFKPA